MVTEQKKRKFLPYLIIGLVAFYSVHWLVKLYEISPASDGISFIDNTRLDWMMSHWSSKGLIDFSFTQPSIYAGGLGFFIVMMFYLRVSDKGR